MLRIGAQTFYHIAAARQVQVIGGTRHASRMRPRNWHIAGIPPPQSLVHFGDVNLRKPKREGYAQPLDDADEVDELEMDVDEDADRSNYAERQGAYARSADPKMYEYRAHHETMRKSFPGGWNPPRRLSREAMAGLRALHAHDPEMFSTPALAAKFRISPEAVRRILRSRWEPSPEARARMTAREAKARAAADARFKQDAKAKAAGGEGRGQTKDRLELV